MWFVWATRGCSIPAVGLPSDVATAVLIATSEEVSPRSASPSHCLALRWFRSHVGRVGVGPQLGRAVVVSSPSHCLALRWFRSHVGRVGVGPQLGRAVVVCGRACGETFLLTWLLGVSRGDTWLFLPDLVEVWDVGCLCRVVFGPTLVLGHGVTLFRCFVVLCSRDWLSLLSLVREPHPLLSSGGGMTFGVPGGGVQEVRESRRLLALLIVRSRTIAELGLHHQQCNFLSLYTSEYAP
ncbi:hypothetical protein Taro_040878, partial [Colocasia esculenta]|nr:hypothetical protein [Colocasia esculenta]